MWGMFVYHTIQKNLLTTQVPFGCHLYIPDFADNSWSGRCTGGIIMCMFFGLCDVENCHNSRKLNWFLFWGTQNSYAGGSSCICRSTARESERGCQASNACTRAGRGKSK